MKIIDKIVDWLNAKDIGGDLGANMLVSFFRYGILIIIILTVLMSLIFKT